jgi:endonuclease/exonuclease/phosphatase family metal-dependent hydrolase
MKITKKNTLFVCFSILSIIFVVAPNISAESLWFSSILAHFALPVVVLHLALFPLFLYKMHWVLFVQILVIGLGTPMIFNVYIFDSFQKEYTSVEHDNVRVLSYNVGFFRVKNVFSPQYYSSEYNLVALSMREWISSRDADIVCLQEFFDDKNSEIFNNIDFLEKENNYKHKFLYKALHENGTRRGLATFSKYPIIKHGTVFLSENRYNGAMFTDLKVFNDTIRIINIHLESFNIFEKKNIKNVFTHLDQKIMNQHFQTKKILEIIQKSPYKVILCGDFNALPYSYIYQTFSEMLKNAFEQAGSGFGGTYKIGFFPPFLRIDNQFAHSSFKVQKFVLHKEQTYSDHLPIEVGYSFPSK